MIRDKVEWFHDFVKRNHEKSRKLQSAHSVAQVLRRDRGLGRFTLEIEFYRKLSSRLPLIMLEWYITSKYSGCSGRSGCSLLRPWPIQ